MMRITAGDAAFETLLDLDQELVSNLSVLDPPTSAPFGTNWADQHWKPGMNLLLRLGRFGDGFDVSLR